MAPITFHRLDFLYMPSKDVAAETRYFESSLGGRVIFAIEDMGTRVAMIELADAPPRILLAGHLSGDRPVLVYRVPDLTEALQQLDRRVAAKTNDRDTAGAVSLV